MYEFNTKVGVLTQINMYIFNSCYLQFKKTARFPLVKKLLDYRNADPAQKSDNFIPVQVMLH